MHLSSEKMSLYHESAAAAVVVVVVGIVAECTISMSSFLPIVAVCDVVSDTMLSSEVDSDDAKTGGFF